MQHDDFCGSNKNVPKEHETKDGIPNGLIDGDLCGNSQWSSPGKFIIEKSVKVVAGGTVN
jgi:hypothetical protein